MDEILFTGVTSTAVFSLGAIYVVWSSNFLVCEQNPPCFGHSNETYSAVLSHGTILFSTCRVDLT